MATESKKTTTKEVLKDKADKNEKITLKDRVNVEITKDHKYFAKGYTFQAHPSMAEVHVKGGYAKITK